MKTQAILITILLFFSTITYGQQTLQYADSVRIACNIPELSYAVITDKNIMEIAAIGRHSIELPDTATLNDRFHIGSNTKAMTAFMIAKYVEGGKLKWLTKFFDIFPKWKDGSRSVYYNITLEDLLSHRARIQPFQGENDPTIPDFKGTEKQKREQFGKFILTLDPIEPDSLHPFTYSNADYTLATLMVEKVTKMSWEQLINKVINEDLNLNVKFSWPDNQNKNDTWGHFCEDGKMTPVPSNTDSHLTYTEPAGDLNIRLKDYIKFIQLNIAGLEGKDNYLKASTYKFIHMGIEQYSLGWFNIYENGKSFSAHAGTAGTYYTLVQIDRERLIGYIIFTNAFCNETVEGVKLLMRKLKQNYGS